MSDLEQRLEEVFAADARARRVERVHLTPRSSGGPLAGAAFVAAVSLAVVAAIVALGLLRPQDRGPVAASPSAAASTSPSPSQAPSATASGSMATPRDLVLPAGCSLLGPPTTTDPGPVTTWEVNCGAKPDATAVERFTPVLAQQGWVLCKSGQGRGFWWKGATQTIVAQSAAGYPTLSQLPRQPDDCPAAAARPEKHLGYISHGSGGALPILRTESDATPIRTFAPETRIAATRDGRRVAYVRTGQTGQQLHVFDTARATQERTVLDLSGSGEEAGGLVWATDADEVLVAIHKMAGTAGAKEYSRLVAVDMASGRTREIYRSTSGLALEPLAWRASTATAAAIETGPGGYAVTYVHLRGAAPTRHPMDAQVIASSVRASADGERIVQVDGLGRAPTRGVTWWPAARYDERQRIALAEHDVSVALWRPGTDELVVFVTPMMKTTSPGPRIERWSLTGAKRMVRETGAPAVVRVDGSAVITTGGVLVDLETGDATPIPGARNDLWPRVAVAF